MNKKLNFLNKGISTPVGILIILIFAIAIGGVFAWQLSQPPKEEIKTLDETADWKTYRNEEYGFELKYPRDWENCPSSKYYFLSIIPPISVFDYPEETNVKTAKGYSCLYGSMTFRAMEEKYNALDNLKAYHLNLYKEGGCPSEWKGEPMIKDIIFNGYPALKAEGCDPTGQTTYYTIGLIQGDHVFKISVPHYYFSGADKVISEILSTFKFIERREPTADWKTYRNEDFGFEIKYPEDWSYGSNLLRLAPNMVFCPPELSDLDTSLGCKVKSTGPHMPDTFAPILLFVYGLEHFPGDINRRGVWEDPGMELIYNLSLSDESFRNIYEQMLSTFRFLE